MEKEVIFFPSLKRPEGNRETVLKGRCRRDEVCQERVRRGEERRGREPHQTERREEHVVKIERKTTDKKGDMKEEEKYH